MSAVRITGLAILSSVLVACGGSSGSGSSAAPGAAQNVAVGTTTATVTPTEPADNRAPVADDSVVELSDWETHEGVLPGSDPDGDSLRFEIVESFVPFVIMNPATGEYSYEPLRTKKSGEVVYQVIDEHGLAATARITFLHDTDLELAAGECPRETMDFGEPVARVWTHPDDSVLFVGFGADRVTNVRRYQFSLLGEDYLGPVLELQGTVLGQTDQLLVDPDDPAVIYALTFEHELLMSHDTGLSFEPVASFPPAEPVLDMAVTGGQSAALWAVTERGIYRASKDNLEFTLSRAFDDPIPSGDHSIAVHPDRPDRLLVGGPEAMLLTEDGGTTWTDLPAAPTYRLVIDPHDPDRVYGNGGNFVYLSTDFGTTWQYVGFNAFDNDVLVADPLRPGRLYIAPWNVFQGLWVSEDAGESFDRVDGIGERVRGMAFTSGGGMYVTQDQSLRCLPQFERPLLAANDTLTANLRIEDPEGQSVAERNLLEPVLGRLTVNNLAGRPLSDVDIDVWVEGPGSRSFALRESGITIDPEGVELLVDLPSPLQVGRYKVVASVDPSDDAPVGTASFFVAVTDPPETVVSGDVAVLSMNTLWLNVAHPWFPIVTEVGEQRRTVLDVENEGPDTARNVIVRIATGYLLTVDSVGPAYSGQTVSCYSDANAVTCALGDIAAGSTVSLELYVTPLTKLSAVPVSLSSDTPDHGFLSGGLDLVTELSGPTEVSANSGIGYTITVTNTGDERVGSGLIRGALGPWPAITGAHGVAFSNPACSLDSVYPDEDVPLTYNCSFWFLKPGERFVVDVEIEAAAAANEVVHIVDAIGSPDDSSSYWFELFRGNNLAGLITRSSAP